MRGPSGARQAPCTTAVSDAHRPLFLVFPFGSHLASSHPVIAMQFTNIMVIPIYEDHTGEQLAVGNVDAQVFGLPSLSRRMCAYLQLQ